jgi:hypothetical protein
MENKLVPDDKCAQGRCACITTGCWGKCALENASYTIAPEGSQNQPQKAVAWLWTMHGWTVTAHGKHRSINRYVDLCKPPVSTQESPDFISLVPLRPIADKPEGKAEQQTEPFQARVQPWMMACFGPEISADVMERNHRFFEESTELVQACGMTQSEAHQLVDYVYGRPVGEKYQEAGGVMVTLAALCLAQGLDMHAAGETELARIWTKVEQIRAKQAAKPKHSPLPMAVQPERRG